MNTMHMPRSRCVPWIITLSATLCAVGCLASTEEPEHGDSDQTISDQAISDLQEDDGTGPADMGGEEPDLQPDLDDDPDVMDSTVDPGFDPDLGSTDITELTDLRDENVIRGSIVLPDSASVQGEGSSRVGGVSFNANVGTIEIGSNIRALIYEVQRWDEYSLILYHVVAPEADNLNILYLYLYETEGNSMDYIWHESYDDVMDWENASGSFTWLSRSTTTQVEMARLQDLPASGQLLSGFTVTGNDIDLDSSGGTITLGRRDFDAYPFESVDCTTDCSASPADGWWEMHMVLEDPQTSDKCFGIIYLMKASPGQAYFDHGFCLDELTHMSQATLTATWTAPGGKNLPDSLPEGPRHPELGYVLRPGPGQLE